MSAATTATAATMVVRGSRRTQVKWAVADSAAMTWRNLLKYVRLPQLLVFSTVQPVMFVLLFTYVFGGAIHVPGLKYVDYLLPGIFVQAVIFGSAHPSQWAAPDRVWHRAVADETAPRRRFAPRCGCAACNPVKSQRLFIPDRA